MSEIPDVIATVAVDSAQHLIGVRLRERAMAEDHLTTETDLHVGDFVVVETASGTAVAEVRRPSRPVMHGGHGPVWIRRGCSSSGAVQTMSCGR